VENYGCVYKDSGNKFEDAGWNLQVKLVIELAPKEKHQWRYYSFWSVQLSNKSCPLSILKSAMNKAGFERNQSLVWDMLSLQFLLLT
jgi:hypothetical protein